MRLDFIDEYWLFINPVALRAPVFGELEMPLELSRFEARTFDDTVLLVCYAP